ncbi:MAG: dephospho-CoA kinase [Armatimonadota bacterium]|nr:dephospho-CoA kinase [Armatimonadota bacterium]MCX7777727.1 dephospho-CoA kinase [Armatimonadota bacterium]MDW8025858.1 dephospho-CoA kinase [Armatimonadota bacterium]
MYRRVRSTVIGLTGAIASGKSTVSRIIARHGVLVINADLVGHRLLNRGEVGWGRIVGNFGTGVLNSARNVDRGKLARCVFSDGRALKRLNRLLHPLMVKRIESAINDARSRGANLIVVEAAVLFEMGMRKNVDEVWVTHADERTILQRLIGRGMSMQEAFARMRSQVSPDEFMRRANRVITCNRSPSETARILRSAVKGTLRCWCHLRGV